jgi:hypothetical protein
MRFLTILTGRNVPIIRQPAAPAPSTINEKTIAAYITDNLRPRRGTFYLNLAIGRSIAVHDS